MGRETVGFDLFVNSFVENCCLLQSGEDHHAALAEGEATAREIEIAAIPSSLFIE